MITSFVVPIMPPLDPCRCPTYNTNFVLLGGGGEKKKERAEENYLVNL